jgi:hypothetical protein
MIFNQNSRIPESKNRNSILKHFSMLRKKMLIFLTATSLIALFLADTKLRQLSDKRTRYFRSFAFSAAESETPIRSFDDLKNVSFVAKMEPRGHLPQSWNVTLREPTPEILK